MKKVNLNEYVYVKLNEKGKEIIAKHPVHSLHTKPDADGVYRIQLWDFMTVFGEGLMVGSDPISEENCIYFDEKNGLKGGIL